MKILVTGSAGFIATNLIPCLANLGHQIIGVDSFVSGSSNHLDTACYCDHFNVDISDTQSLLPLLSNIDVVIHLAAKGNVVDSIADPFSNFRHNVEGSISLLEAMRQAGCSKIIFSSTGGALMGNAKPPVNELTIPKPISPYGASKLACEGYLSAYCESFDFSSIVLRFGNVYGPFSRHKVGVINKWIRSVIRDEPITIYGDGNSSRDYIHVQDLCHGIVSAFNRLSASLPSQLETFHLANHSEITLSQLFELVSSCSANKPNAIFSGFRKGEVNRNFADISLAKKFLNFSPVVGFDEGVRGLYNWIHENEF